MQFLSKQAVADIALCRQMISEAELVIKADLDVLTTQSPHLGIYKSNCTENGDIVDWDLDWDTDEPTNAANDKNVALNKLLEEKIAANAKVINHFKTSVSEGVRHTMGAIHELITQFDATKHLPKNTNDAVPTNLCPDILSVSPTMGDSKDEEVNKYYHI